ncbi:MAG: ATP-binding protein [Lachnospiraceae bacterium]|nr:ATP-binding protein [Lachnospiraceae bacterium]
MTCYQNMINDLTDIIQREGLPYKDTIIIGNNSSGKSELVKNLLQKAGFENWYLIDAVNRYFSVSQIYKMSGEASKLQFSKKIAEHRLEEDNFNLKDTFYYMGVPTSIENFYFEFATEIKRLIQQFLDVRLEIKQTEVGYEVYLDNVISTLSSGYQALIRIFMEMEYVKRTMERGTIIIDEIDEFLFAYNSGRIFEFLRHEYSQFSFVVTTHSADLIANAMQANILLLSDGTYEFLDADDFNSVSQVYNIFDSIFKDTKISDYKDRVDTCLRRLLNNKVSGIWVEADENEFMRIKEMNLTKVQKVLIRQIEEW